MERDDSFRDLLRDAAEPDLAPNAAGRIAAGAWERAAEIRREAARGALRDRRTKWLVAPVAAAAALLVGVALALRASVPVFAVEGDPVQVLADGAWSEARQVPVGSLVYVPLGSRTSVRGPDDATI